MQLAADRALELTGAEAAMVQVPDGPDSLRFEVTAGDAESFRATQVGRADSFAGLALRERRILLSDDAAHDDRVYAPLRKKMGFRSLICAPLFHRGRTIGVLSVYHSEPHRFGAADTQSLELMSDLIAAHLSHASTLAEEAHQSRHDALTGLPNRRAYEERLHYEASRATRYGHPLTLCLLDLDGFKAVNDELGHPAGDAILCAVADAIRATRTADEGFRIGGDEFAVLLPETTADGGAIAVRRLIEAIGRSGVRGGDRIGVSFGIAAADEGAEALHAAADARLLAAKAALYGRDRHGRLAA
jgi:diguanylate cyclase (GGDEF)-like protein